MATSSNEGVVKVKREKFTACMTCSLYSQLLDNATTIIECLHSFSSKCIHDKIIDEELFCCPICKTDLGCAPLEKLRDDHNLQDLIAKIFPSTKRKNAGRKGRDLSTTMVNIPRVFTQTSMFDLEEPAAKLKISNIRGEESQVPQSHPKFKDQSQVSKAEDCGNSSKSAPPYSMKLRTHRVHHNPVEETIHDDENGANSPSTHFVNPNHGRPKKESITSKESKPPVQNSKSLVQVVDAASSRLNSVSNPIWLSLTASTCSGFREGYEPLPQITTPYLRIKDGSLTVLIIKKYLAKVLGLSSECEVELEFQGQPLIPILTLHTVIDMWLKTKPRSEMIKAYVGSPAKAYVMELIYARKAPVG